jgi:hypothetical protein
MTRRSRILWLSATVAVAILLLASSLHDVHFEPGPTFGAGARPRTQVALTAIQILSDTPVWKIVLVWLAFTVYLILFLFVIPAQLRRRILRQLLSFSVGILMLLLALRLRLLQLPALFGQAAQEGGGAVPQVGNEFPVPAFHAPPIPTWLAYVVSVLVLWAVFAPAWLFYRRRQSRKGRGSTLGAIEDIARSSLDDLAAGRDWSDVVIGAYVRMSQAVSLRRGLQRHHAATAREFADRLTRAGLPADAVEGLTRLFESVRYGGQKSSDLEVSEATGYLESILRACGAPA